MNCSIEVYSISMGWPILHFKGSQAEFSKLWCISIPEGCLNINAAFHLGFHCLPRYPLRGFQYTKG